MGSCFKDGSGVTQGVVSIPLPSGHPRGTLPPVGAIGHNGSAYPFLVGPENRLVEVVARAVLEDQPTAPRYNPLLVCAGPGLGKTHFVEGLAAAYRKHHGQRSVACAAGVDFAREFTDAIESQATDEFRQRYRGVSLLIIEDLTRLADKESVQWELLHTVDAVLASGGRVVVTASTRPSQWSRMLPGLQSRLASGLTVSFSPPGRDARLAILQQAGRQRGCLISDSVGTILADGLQATPAELVGVIAELRMMVEAENWTLDDDTARAYLARRQQTRQLDMAAIAGATARSFSLRVSQLRGRSRRREVVTARCVAMYLTRQLTQKTLNQIGQFFGGRDHTTVLYGCRRTEVLLQTEPTIQEIVQHVRCSLQVV